MPTCRVTLAHAKTRFPAIIANVREHLTYGSPSMYRLPANLVNAEEPRLILALRLSRLYIIKLACFMVLGLPCQLCSGF
jgi:hypothetical protein